MTSILSDAPTMKVASDEMATGRRSCRPERLRTFEYLALAALAVGFLSYGILVVVRSAYLDRPYTDLGVFLRAAWAARTGHDIYAVTFNDLYYCYPSLLAVLLVPLALPPEGQDTAGMLPLEASAAIWYLLSLGCLFWGVHRLAGALEAQSTHPSAPGSRKWAFLRTMPIWAFLIPIGSALGHGQTNLLFLALVCGMMAALIRGQRFQAGLWMSATICLKIFPLYLLIYPLWRRDGRCLAGCCLGLLLGLAVLPSLVFGPAQAMAYNRKIVELVVLPSLSEGQDKTRAKTLTDITATDTQSFMAMLHNTMHLDRDLRPKQASSLVFWLHLLIAGALTLATLWAGGWHRSGSAPKETVFVGMLVVVMMMTSPVCHLHYFPWFIPLLMGLIQLQWDRGAPLYLGYGWCSLFVVNNVVHILSHLREQSSMLMLRDLCICSYVGLGIWLLGLIILRADKDRPSVVMPAPVADAPGSVQIQHS
jgi:alpha-1,2-mannosyltransferase